MQTETRLVGQSSALLDAVERASRAAALSRSVLVIGERGTGKEMIAERLHRLSPRWEEPLVALNCAALPENLLDAELFGYEPGAFTGAVRARAGRFEEADGGTLFLDEIATLSAAAQERLLRVVEYGQLTRLGSNKPVRVDVRVIGATNEDLPRLADCGRFRADLLDRLSFEVITLPPLRARADDIQLLADHFGRRMAAEIGWSDFPGFTPAIRQALAAHRWPGNVRELKNVVERAVYRWNTPDAAIDAIELDPFASPWRPPPAPAAAATPDASAPNTQPPQPAEPDGNGVSDLRAAVDGYEARILAATLERCRFNQRDTAAALSLSYDQLRHALKRHGLLAATRRAATR